MQSIAQYALVGSLVAAAAGVLVLAGITVKYGLRRRIEPSGEDPDAVDEAARRVRTVRTADTLAVFCFAVAAGLGVLGVSQHTQGMTSAQVNNELADRMQALEQRLAAAELRLQGHIEARPWDAKLATFERRLAAIQERTANAERLVRERQETPVGSPRRTTPAVRPAPPPTKPATPTAPSASPRLAPTADEMIVAPEDVAPPPVAPAPKPPMIAAAPPPPTLAPAPPTPPPLAPAAPAMSRARTPPPPPADKPLIDRLRNDWEAVKEAGRRGGDEWRDGWRKLRRLFTD